MYARVRVLMCLWVSWYLGGSFFIYFFFIYILLFADALTEPFLVGIVRKRGGLSLGLLKN
jgi:hypothetical protein